MNLRPRQYLSYSQMIKVENSPKSYIEDYIYGRKTRTTRAMAYGSLLADSMEKEEDTGDVGLDIVIAQLPRFELNDVAFMTEIPKDKDNEAVPLLIKMDTRKKDLTAFKEYKTGTKKWTQEKADKSDQVTFYAMGAYLKTGKIPKDIELIHMPTEINDEGKPQVTGEIHRFPTQRNLTQVLKMMVRARKAWKRIGEICENELV